MVDDESRSVGEYSFNVRTSGTIACCKVVKQTIVRKDCNLVWRKEIGSFSEKRENRKHRDVHIVPVVQSV